MPRHCAVLDGGRPLPKRDRVDDMPARMGRRALRPSIGPPLPEVSHQRLLEHAAALHEQAEIDRFVRHAHGRIIRIRLAEPAGDLLRRPFECALGGHRITQCGVRRHAPALRAPAARPRPSVSGRGPVPAWAAVAPHFPTYRRRCAPQVPTDLPQGQAPGHAAGDYLPLGQRQGLACAPSGYRGYAARPGHDVAHPLGNPPQRAAAGIQRFPLSPAALQFRLLCRGQTRATSSHHETSILGSCCIDSLNSPVNR